MAGGRPSKRNKIIPLLKQGETSKTIIANRVGWGFLCLCGD